MFQYSLKVPQELTHLENIYYEIIIKKNCYVLFIIP